MNGRYEWQSPRVTPAPGPTPATWEEAMTLTGAARADLHELEAQLADPGLRSRLRPREYGRWRANALARVEAIRARLAELRAWRAAHPRVGQTPEQQVGARRQRHAERVAAWVAGSGVRDPRDPTELVRLLLSAAIDAHDRGAVEWTEAERDVQRVAREYLHMIDGQESVLARRGIWVRPGVARPTDTTAAPPARGEDDGDGGDDQPW